jgi:DNA polymerase III subunit epsilon
VSKREWQLWAATALIGLFCLSWLLVAGLLLWVVLDGQDWIAVTEALGGRAGLLLFLWALALVPVHGLLKQLIERYVSAPARLAEEIELRLEGRVSRPIEHSGSAEIQRLGELVNELLAERTSHQEDIDERVRTLVRASEQDKARLAALMAELDRSVVVCNLDGRILFYNQRARRQFGRMSSAAGLTGGSELIGLGRSIYAALDREGIAHALEAVQRQLKRGQARPSAQFVFACSTGRLLRVQLSPVRSVDERGQVLDQAGGETISGFVLLTENITEEIQTASEKDRLLNALSEGSRAGLASIRAAIEVLEDPKVDQALRERLLAVIAEESRSLSERIEALHRSSSEALKTRWPLEEMPAADLIDTAVRRIEAELPVKVAREDDRANLWLKVESFALVQGLVHLAGCINRECRANWLSLRLSQHDGRALLDLVWTDEDGKTRPQADWENALMEVGGHSLGMTFRDLIDRHGGECWLDSEHTDDLTRRYFRLLLPLAESSDAPESRALKHFEGRPEFFDFDLFAAGRADRALNDCPLAELSLTVFDTETTGLNPAEGDEIIQIGAVRIVNGRIISGEYFDQLVDPQRKIPAASIPIHGITPDMVAGQPTIDEVLPAFHAFCRDTVLVAHNAAFDMKCLEMKQQQTGLHFDQPVLDTLLLSVLVHENQDRHNLDDIAERFGLTILGRHTAFGDAMVTAEIFVRLIPLLAEKGIDTLGQALAAARKTWAARVRY